MNAARRGLEMGRSSAFDPRVIGWTVPAERSFFSRVRLTLPRLAGRRS